jgi:hypothetical protein
MGCGRGSGRALSGRQEVAEKACLRSRVVRASSVCLWECVAGGVVEIQLVGGGAKGRQSSCVSFVGSRSDASGEFVCGRVCGGEAGGRGLCFCRGGLLEVGAVRLGRCEEEGRESA